MIQEYTYVRMQTLEHPPSWAQHLVPVTTHHLTEIQLVEVHYIHVHELHMDTCTCMFMYVHFIMCTMSYMYLCV